MYTYIYVPNPYKNIYSHVYISISIHVFIYIYIQCAFLALYVHQIGSHAAQADACLTYRLVPA